MKEGTNKEIQRPTVRNKLERAQGTQKKRRRKNCRSQISQGHQENATYSIN